MRNDTRVSRTAQLYRALRSGTALGFALLAGAGAISLAGLTPSSLSSAAHANPCTANPCAANPCAATCAPMSCAAAPCSADHTVANPCAANPCAADPRAANPCAATKGVPSNCYLPSAQQSDATPCAAEPTAANPCAATCTPAATTANPCGANPCAPNPCAAASAGAANPCAVSCAANPCAANPCAANPCAANPSAANSCAAATPQPDASDEDLQALYECLIDKMEQQAAAPASGGPILSAWTQSERSEAQDFAGWTNFARTPYISSTHGERFATNHANDIAAAHYGRYEDIGEMPSGGIVAKPTFSISASDEALWETLFLMEKAPEGTSPDTNDWIYTAILPDGSLMGRTLGQNSDAMVFCASCHMGMGAESDDLTFLPEDYRIRN